MTGGVTAPSGGSKIIFDDFTGDKTMKMGMDSVAKRKGPCPLWGLTDSIPSKRMIFCFVWPMPPLGANRLNSLKAYDFLFCVKFFNFANT